MVTAVFAVATAGLVVAAAAAAVRLVRGPTGADRVIALDALTMVVAAGVAVRTAETGNGDLVDLLLFLALLSFVGTVTAARFLETINR